MMNKKNYPTPNGNTRDLERKIENMSESIAYFQGCIDTIGKELYRLNDRVLELKYLIKEKK